MTNPSPSSNGASSDSKGDNSTKIILIVLGLGLCCVGVPVLGILMAIALPSFLNQADRARETEALVTIGSMARAQQAYRLESPEFATTVEELGVGIAPESPNYTYAIVPQPDPAASVYMTATPQIEGLSGISSGVFSTDDTGETTQVVCESEDATPPPMPSFDPASGVATCPDGSSEP